MIAIGSDFSKSGPIFFTSISETCDLTITSFAKIPSFEPFRLAPMFNVVYSNAYEVLQTYLRVDLEAYFAASSKPFPSAKVVVGTQTLQEKLTRDLSEAWGVCAGIEFQTVGAWLSHYLASDLTEGSTSSDFLWLLYSILSDDFTNRYPRLNRFFEHAKTNRTAELARYELASRIADTFAQYVNYRLDWVLEWMGVQVAEDYRRLAKPGEKEILAEQPDYEWQRDLWKAIHQRLARSDRANNPLAVLDRFSDYNKLKSEIQSNEPESLFIFMPMALSPMALPIFKVLNDLGRNVYVYLFNPCQAFWFDAYDPENEQNEREEKTLLFLRRNAAATRAMINRFNVFAEDTGAETHDPSLVYKPIFSHAYYPSVQALLTDWRSLKVQAQVSRSDLNLALSDPGQASVLHAVQQAILENKAAVLPKVINPDDHSIRLVKAPTLTREVENAVDMIHAMLSSNQDMKPSDILVVTPDIEALAPAVHATFASLPADRRIDYRIAGQKNTDEASAGDALIQLGRMMSEGILMASLESWLELPLVAETFGLELDDLSVLKGWLLEAGFRNGLSEKQIQKVQAEDDPGEEVFEGTLQRAIERLSWGFVTEGRGFATYDLIPVRRSQSAPFSDIHNLSKLFETLLTISGKLSETYDAWLKVSGVSSVSDWIDWTGQVLERFFGTRASEQSLAKIKARLRAFWQGMTVYEGATLPFEVYWQALSDALGENASGGISRGVVTFAGMSAFRRIPFKAIIMLGLNEDSAFPGREHFEEFNLMGISQLHRQGDRDSRRDNRNVFLDLVLSARRYLVISYSVGVNKKAPKDPSPLVHDLLELINTNTNVGVGDWDQALATEIALSAASLKNFSTDPVRFWKSSDKTLFDSLCLAHRLPKLHEEEPFAQGALSESLFDSETIALEELIAFYTGTPTWLAKRLGLSRFDGEEPEAVSIKPDTSALTQSLLRRDVFESFESGVTANEILEQMKLDPTKGAFGTRHNSYQAIVENWYSAFSLKNAFLSKAVLSPVSTVLEIPGFESRRFKNISVNLNQVYEIDAEETSDENKAKKRVLFDEVFSKAQRVRVLLRLCALNAAGFAYSAKLLISLNGEQATIVDWPAYPQATAKEVIGKIFDAYVAVTENILALSSPYSDDVQTLLWRGSDLKSAQELRGEFDSMIQKLLGI